MGTPSLLFPREKNRKTNNVGPTCNTYVDKCLPKFCYFIRLKILDKSHIKNAIHPNFFALRSIAERYETDPLKIICLIRPITSIQMIFDK